MQHQSKSFQEWVDEADLGNAESRLIELAATGSGQTVFNTNGFNFLTWAIETEKTATFTVEGSFNEAFSTFFNLYNISCLANTLCTPYNLAAPQNNNGFVVISMPFIRLRLLDTAAAAHADTQIYARAWG